MNREKEIYLNHTFSLEERYFVAQTPPQPASITQNFKIATFSVSLLLFFAFGITTILGLIGKVRINDNYFDKLFNAVIITGIIPIIFSLTELSTFLNNTDEQLSEEEKELTKKVEELDERVTRLTNDNKNLKQEIQELEQNFLIRLVKFHRDTKDFGESLNFTYPPHEDKPQLAKRFLELLKEIGQYEEDIVASPKMAKDALKKYQKSLGFTQVDWYSKDVFYAMIREYIKIGSREQQIDN